MSVYETDKNQSILKLIKQEDGEPTIYSLDWYPYVGILEENSATILGASFELLHPLDLEMYKGIKPGDLISITVAESEILTEWAPTPNLTHQPGTHKLLRVDERLDNKRDVQVIRLVNPE